MEEEAVYHGVDFSGAGAHARKLWVSTLAPGERAVAAAGFHHGDLVAAIRESAADRRRHYWLIDAPFALPLDLLERHGVPASWRAAADWLASFDGPRAWRRACRQVSRREPRRPVDRRFRTPLPPTNIRIFRQTWHAIVSVLLLLRAESGVLILPMALAEEGAEGDARRRLETAGAWVGEGCPSSTLRSCEWPIAGYKGRAERNRSLRGEILERLANESDLAIDPATAQAAVEDAEGDGVDSLVLLSAAKRLARSDPQAILKEDARAAVEGWVFV